MERRSQYDNDGYLVLENFFTDVEIKEILKHVEYIFNPWMINNRQTIFDQKLVNMHSLTSLEYFGAAPQRRIQFFDVLTPLKLCDLLEEMFGSGIHFHNTQLFFNPLNDLRLPYWHRDMQYSSIDDQIQEMEQNKMLSLHIRIPLIKEKGVELVTGSHKRWDTELEKNVRLELNGHKNSEPLPNSVLIELNPGDILIFSAQMIHRGNYKLNETRKALDLCVGKYHHLASEFLDEKVLPTQEEMKSIKNKHWYQLAREIVNKKPSA